MPHSAVSKHKGRRYRKSDGKEKFLKTIKALVSVLALLGMIFFFVPVFLNYFTAASLFGEAVCIIALVLANFRPLITNNGKRKVMSVLCTLATVFYIVFIGWLGFVTMQMFTVSYDIPEKDATLVVLGARVYEDGVSMSLKNRLDAAIDYLEENPEANVIVTGGQGYNEPWTEASAEKAYLLSKGIDESRIFMEDRSTSTSENLEFSWNIIKSNGLNENIVIVTHGYHQFRARRMAEDWGYTAYGVKCECNSLLFPTYYARELMAVTKYYIDKLI